MKVSKLDQRKGLRLDRPTTRRLMREAKKSPELAILPEGRRFSAMARILIVEALDAREARTESA